MDALSDVSAEIAMVRALLVMADGAEREARRLIDQSIADRRKAFDKIPCGTVLKFKPHPAFTDYQATLLDDGTWAGPSGVRARRDWVLEQWEMGNWLLTTAEEAEQESVEAARNEQDAMHAEALRDLEAEGLWPEGLS
jgi:hypothetical protein